MSPGKQLLKNGKMSLLLNQSIRFIKNQLILFPKTNVANGNLRVFCLSTNANENSDTSDDVKPHADLTQEQRSLHVAVIGVPNAGKSTFINNLINHRVCPTSSKVHTTRNSNKAIWTTGNTQLVFFDTPGLVTQREIKKHNLEKSFKNAYRQAVKNSDLIAVMHDASNTFTRNELHSTVIDTLKEFPALPSILILNKIDALKSKRVLLDLIKTLTNDTLNNDRKKARPHLLAQKDRDNLMGDVGSSNLYKRETSWSHFSDVFLVSSITGNGLEDLQHYLVNSAKAKAWQYSSEVFTDMTPEALIEETVRARLLDYLPQEIPYNLKSVIEYYSVENNIIYASVQVICPSERIDRLICGEGNGRLRQITERVISDLVETFGKAVSLTISTTSQKTKSS